jgi:6-hydroxycyclohex-1-ene-1-carbonyl-CoA dehydrogenase
LLTARAVMTAHRWLMTEVNAPLVREEFDTSPAAGEVVVEVAGCGVCHTDLGYLYDGVRPSHALPLALGHEISGRVVAAGAGAEAHLGKAVIVPAVVPCGACGPCSRGRPHICAKQKMPGNHCHGGFASHVVVPAFGLCHVDEARLAAAGLSLAEVSVVADAMTTPYEACKRAGVGPGSFAVVIGAGGVGGYAVQIAAALGAKVVALDVDPAKLEAISSVAAGTFNVKELDAKVLKKAVGAVAAAHGLPSTEWNILECSGTGAGQLTAFGLLVHGATLSVVGFTMDKIELRLSNLMAYDARAIGNWGCAPDLYPGALELVLEGKVLVAPFVEKHPLSDVNRVLQAVHHREIKRRVVLTP